MLIVKLQGSAAEKLTRIASQRGLSLDAAAEEIVRSTPEVTTNGHAAAAPNPTPDPTWEARFDAMIAEAREWSEKNLPPGYVADDSRDSIYEGRGE